ncbi:MAG: amidohydrolase, partial [Erythrobacteraceae bacterium]|nr:amidohydrolase [Erythrobacteraceae bacterium]
MIPEFRLRARTGVLATLASALALTACATTGSAGETGSARSDDKTFAARTESEGVFASTYKAYPGIATALKGATVFDGRGGRIENGVVFFSGGKIVAVGGPDTPIPADIAVFDGTGKFVTPGIIDIHSHLGDYPSPGVDAHS